MIGAVRQAGSPKPIHSLVAARMDRLPWTVFPEDGIGEFDGARGRAQREDDGLEYIRPIPEKVCLLMATAHAKFTGKRAVRIAISSPGAFHTAIGPYGLGDCGGCHTGRLVLAARRENCDTAVTTEAARSW